VVLDHKTSMLQILRQVAQLPLADVVYATDDSRTTLLLALFVRGKRKTGWVQGRSMLYAEGGYFEWKSVRPWLSFLAKLAFRPGRVRLPEDKFEGDVELELLDLSGSGRPLAHYRSRFAWTPARRTESGYLYCAAEAGWSVRQLTDQQWNGIIARLLEEFPTHSIVVHGASSVVESFATNRRVVSFQGTSVEQLFEKVSGADLVIAPDSFVLHLASLYNVPAIGYFGPAHPHRFRPTGPGSGTLFRQPQCSPCLQNRGTAPCRKGLTQCTSLAQLTPADFITAAEVALTHQES
jgi:ADP-heptose:LPS heptosyltransferase